MSTIETNPRDHSGASYDQRGTGGTLNGSE